MNELKVVAAKKVTVKAVAAKKVTVKAVGLVVTGNVPTNIADNVTGKQLTLQSERCLMNRAIKARRSTLTSVLSEIKQDGLPWLKKLNDKFTTNVTLSQLQSITASELGNAMSIEGQIKHNASGCIWSPWKVSGLIAKIYSVK